MTQLALQFSPLHPYHTADFIAAASNAAAREWLARPASWTNGRMVLWGEPGCGKTHLLHMFARTHAALILPATQLDDLPTQPIVIDDADTVANEAGLLHLLNRAAEARLPVLLAARQPPGRSQVALPDLASRLRASLAVQILPPEDALLTALLSRLAADRQISLSPAVQSYLLTHLPRTPAALRTAVARLDQAALTAGGKITRAMTAAVVAIEMLPNGHAPDPDTLL